MPSTFIPNGFVHVFNYVQEFNGTNLNVFYVSASDTNALYANMAVKFEGTNKDSTGQKRAITIGSGAATTINCGVIHAFKTVTADTLPGYRASAEVRDVEVISNPDQVFRIQADGAITAAMIGKNAEFNVGTGNSALGYAGSSLKTSTVANDATFPLIIIGISQFGNNLISDAYPYVDVRFNLHAYKSLLGV
jgi:hypothetical protein